MTDRRAADERADADPTDGRDESVNERMDRNWNEILQELRVTQTGTQIFTGFLLTIAFQQRFGDLTTFQTRVYLVLVVAAVLTTALGLAPVNLHRALFRRGAKVTVVQTAHVIMRFTLVGVAVMLIGTVLLRSQSDRGDDGCVQPSDQRVDIASVEGARRAARAALCIITRQHRCCTLLLYSRLRQLIRVAK